MGSPAKSPVRNDFGATEKVKSSVSLVYHATSLADGGGGGGPQGLAAAGRGVSSAPQPRSSA